MNLPGVECSLPGGAFYAFPKVIGTGMNGVEFCKKGYARSWSCDCTRDSFWSNLPMIM